MSESLISALVLRSIPGVGDRTYKVLVDSFGSAQAVLSAPVESVKARVEASDRLVAGLEKQRNYIPALRNYDNCSKLGVNMLHYGGEGYPKLLAQIADPPAILYCRGVLDPHNARSVAIVGSRKATTQGKKFTHGLASDLARSGLDVVSGLAIGVDTCAHEGALDGDGITLAVLGSGIDIIYPSRNIDLARRILDDGGAIISENPPGTEPMGIYFPRRNRIISGLCLGVIVVEAARNSGSLITAECALEQGREVFAVPGVAGTPSSEGAHKLIKQGAMLVENVADVLQGLGLDKPRARPKTFEPLEVDGPALRMHAALEDSPLDIDTLAAKSCLCPNEAASALMELELAGRAQEWSGKRYSRIN